MSAGPIRAERQAHAVTPATTAAKDRVCAPGTATHGTPGRSYCGRKDTKRSTSWIAVNCSECLAARRADEAARS